MPISHYPKGFAHGITVRGMPVLNTYGGKIFWVSSATTLLVGQKSGSNGNKGTFDAPFATIDFAVGQCTASRGDIIMVKEGHVETVTAAAGLELDVAGIAVVFLGEGASQAQVTFTTATGADMNVGAEGITLVNPRFVAGIDALTGPIDVNAAGFKMYNVLVEDAAGIAAVDWYVADANADDLLIDGWDYRVSTTGTQKQSNIQIADATRPVLRHIRITGDFGTGAIENGTAWVDATLDDVFIDNAATGPVVGILLQATSSGQMRDVNIRVASGTTYLTAANDMQFFTCWGVGVDADSAEPIGATVTSRIGTVRSITKSVIGVHTTPIPMFVITGGSIHVISLVGTVVTAIQGQATTQTIECLVTAPAATVAMSTAVDTNADAVGEVYTFVGPTGILTPGAAGLVIIDQGSVTVTLTQWIVPIGTIQVDGGAISTGDVDWVLTYYHNPAATVVAA